MNNWPFQSQLYFQLLYHVRLSFNFGFCETRNQITLNLPKILWKTHEDEYKNSLRPKIFVIQSNTNTTYKKINRNN